MDSLVIDQGDTRVAVAGDWHGDMPWAYRALTDIAQHGISTVYHIGDFGFMGEGVDQYVRKLDKLCRKLDLTLIIVPGNHENWARLDKMFAERPGEPAPAAERIWFLPRGYRWAHAGRSFVALGGAPSIDYSYRVTNKSWWLTEVITETDVEHVAAGGHAEIMLAHDAPAPATPAVDAIRNSSSGWSAEALAYCRAGEDLMTVAYNAVAPQLFLHGHYHCVGDRTFDNGQRILSLDMNGRSGNVVQLDLTAPDFDPKWSAIAGRAIPDPRRMGSW